MGVLEGCVRDHLNEVAPRRIGVLDPVKLIIDNYPAGQTEQCEAPNHPQKTGARHTATAVLRKSCGSSARTSW